MKSTLVLVLLESDHEEGHKIVVRPPLITCKRASAPLSIVRLPQVKNSSICLGLTKSHIVMTRTLNKVPQSPTLASASTPDFMVAFQRPDCI